MTGLAEPAEQMWRGFYCGFAYFTNLKGFTHRDIIQALSFSNNDPCLILSHVANCYRVEEKNAKCQTCHA